MIAGVMVLSGCISVGIPMHKTIGELRTDIKNKTSSGLISESRDISRRWGDVQKSMEKYANRCLNFKSTTTYKRGAADIRYQRTFFEKTGKYKSYMALHVEDKSYVTPIPKGGYYRYILDMESIGKGKSRVTYHGPQLFSSDTINALFEAAEGKNPKFCLADE